MSSVWKVQMQGFEPTWVSPNQQWFEPTLKVFPKHQWFEPTWECLLTTSPTTEVAAPLPYKISVWPFAVKLFELQWPLTTIHSCVLHLYLAFSQNVL